MVLRTLAHPPPRNAPDPSLHCNRIKRIPALYGREGSACHPPPPRRRRAGRAVPDRASVSQSPRSLCRVAPDGHGSALGAAARKPWEPERESGGAGGQRTWSRGGSSRRPPGGPCPPAGAHLAAGKGGFGGEVPAVHAVVSVRGWGGSEGRPGAGGAACLS